MEWQFVSRQWHAGKLSDDKGQSSRALAKLLRYWGQLYELQCAAEGMIIGLAWKVVFTFDDDGFAKKALLAVRDGMHASNSAALSAVRPPQP